MRVTQLLVIVSLISLSSSSTPSHAKKRKVYMEITTGVYEKVLLPLLPRSLKKMIDRVLPVMLKEIGGAVFDQLGSQTILEVPFDTTSMSKLLEATFVQLQDPKWEKMLKRKYIFIVLNNILNTQK